MKLKSGFEVRNVCGENLVVAMGEENIDFTHVITLNETSLFLWEKIENGIDTIDGLVEAITDEYEVDADTARQGVESVVNQLADYGVLEK